MSIEWWKALGLFALGMVALSFLNEGLAIGITLVVGFAAIVLRLSGKAGT